MEISQRHKRMLLITGILIALLSLPLVAYAITNGVFVSGTVPLEASDGPQVDVIVGSESEMDLTDPYPDNNTVEVITEDGTIIFSSNGSSAAEVNSANITGQYTSVTSIDASTNDLTINPEDKSSVTVAGDLNRIEWQDPSLDDGTTDFVYAGSSGTATITIRGAPADTHIGAVDQNGNLLATATSDSSGEATFSGLDSTTEYQIELVTSNGGPELSDPAPTGDLQTAPDNLEINVSDPDFPGDDVDATWYLDGDQINSETVTGEQRISTTIPSSGQTGGEHTWTVEATDRYGQTTSRSQSYRVPDTLEVRNESDPSQLITDPTNVTVQFFGENTVYERTSSDGTIDLEGLPVGQEFSVQVKAEDGYHSRTVQIKSIYDQQTVYLLPDTVDSTETRFVLSDPTGQFPAQTDLYISKAIERGGNVEYRTIHADEFGAEGVTATLESDQRYRLRIEAPDGTTQDMGTYRATVSETIEIRPSGAAVEFSQYDPDANWGLGADIDGEKLFVRFEDPEKLTDQLTISIHERGNESNVLEASETYFNLGEMNSQYNLTENQSKKQWVVNFEIDRDGKTMHKQEVVSQRGDLVPSNLDGAWKHVIGVGLLLLSAGAFSLLNRSVGAVMIGLQGGLLWWTGWLAGATVGAAVVIYLFIAIGYAMYSRTP